MLTYKDNIRGIQIFYLFCPPLLAEFHIYLFGKTSSNGALENCLGRESTASIWRLLGTYKLLWLILNTGPSVDWKTLFHFTYLLFQLELTT